LGVLQIGLEAESPPVCAPPPQRVAGRQTPDGATDGSYHPGAGEGLSFGTAGTAQPGKGGP